jgi:hypothetical protein
MHLVPVVMPGKMTINEQLKVDEKVAIELEARSVCESKLNARVRPSFDKKTDDKTGGEGATRKLLTVIVAFSDW